MADTNEKTSLDILREYMIEKYHLDKNFIIPDRALEFLKTHNNVIEYLKTLKKGDGVHHANRLQHNEKSLRHNRQTNGTKIY
jgi:hypothetical protein